MARLLLAIALLLAVPLATALSASPASKNLQVTDGDVQYAIRILNDEARTLTITLTPTGPLSEHISVQPTVSLAPGANTVLPVSVAMPSSTQPGTIESGILIESRPTSSGMVSATSAVMHVIRLETPREGMYLAADLLTSGAALNEPVAITLSLTNTGTETITDASATILVHGPDQYAFDVPSLTIAPGQTRDAVVTFTPDTLGTYAINATVAYAGKTERASTSIIVGELLVTILGADFGEFRLGELFRVSATVRSEFGQELPVIIEATQRQGGNDVATSKSTQHLLAPAATTPIPVFLQSEGLAVGEAVVDLTALYGGRTSSASFPFVVSIDELATERAQESSSPWIVATAVLLIALFLATSIIFIKRRRPPRHGGA